MANENQNESALPVPGKNKRATSELLPRYFRTEANKKFLQATLDQLTQPGVAEKISGYVGRKNAKAFAATDAYVGDISVDRTNYQLEPAAVIKDNLDNVTFYKDYNDYINQITAFGGNTNNHSRLNSQETYAWNPNIDWDKFVNFRNYYWLAGGPPSVRIAGQNKDVVSTYTVTLADNVDNTSYVFSPDGLTSNPTLKLYRGQTYRFEINTPGHPIAFAISKTVTPGNALITAGREGIRGAGLFDAQLYGNEYDLGEYIVLPDSGSVTFAAAENVSTLYPDGIRKLGEAGEEIANVYIEKGTIEFTIPLNAPNRLYYISKNNVDTSGIVRIYDIEENSFVDVETDILGKKTYKSANGATLTNGMRVNFIGAVTPVQYSKDSWYVEGVGDKIKLINERDLIIPAAYAQTIEVPFDSEKFDSLPFSNSESYAKEKDYIVVNRASPDKNPWSRYNKWVHKDVVIASSTYSKIAYNLDEELRAKRPIIEFEAGLKLFNFGVAAKTDVDLIDTFTLDVFSTIEGSLGYNVDEIDLAEGMRILFTADTDVLVSGKIYQVKFVTINNVRQISLIETADTDPVHLETVFVKSGTKFAGQTFHYHNNVWIQAQQKTIRNQPPLFDLCCPEGNNYTNSDVFNSSTFKGTKLFSYSIGNGTTDSELGFPLVYRNINNSGDIQFEFNLLTDTFTYQTETDIIPVSTSIGNLRKYSNISSFKWANGWASTPTITKQKVIRQYIATADVRNNFEIDVYDAPLTLTDLTVNVFVNNTIKQLDSDYTFDRINKKLIIRFFTDLKVGSTVIIKTNSVAPKNSNGWYDFPINLERNPANQDLSFFTLGEVIDHVDSMIEDLQGFEGTFPGISNLRDLGDLDVYGKRFVKHSGPINLPLYHIANKKYNIVKAIDFSKKEYARFKRTFVETADTLGFDGPVREHVNRVFEEINKDKVKTQSFYFSDMVDTGTNNTVLTYEVLDPRNPYYPLSAVFSATKLSQRSVTVYLNDSQLIHTKDYTFDDQGFVLIDSYQQEGDTITIYESATTDGSFVPPTPTKLGLYPSFYPQVVIDDTFINNEEPTVNGPFKIYGQDEVSQAVGWFYPVYTSRRSAQNADSQGAAVQLQLNGLNRVIYMPANSGIVAGTDNNEIDEYPIGVALIRGHDGSFVKAFKDFKDYLILDLEKRIFNNIKVSYNASQLDVNDFINSKGRITGFSRDEINLSLRPSFVEWLKNIESDYTDNSFYQRENQFTFNYSNMNSAVDGALLPGHWRGVYKEVFDTDRPHSHPWELLGLTNKPKWWNTVYGPAPYTGNNEILWSDLEQGILREPGKEIKVLNKYVRPGLMNFIPSDDKGRLKSPIASSYAKNFFYRYTTQNWKFGDEAPVETAWRRSSDYAFALIKAWLLNQPAKVMGIGFDVSRITKNLAGQYVYTNTLKPITLKDIQVPNTYEDTQRVQTSGLVNYIYNLVASNILTVYDDYKEDLSRLTNQLGFKLGGFTDKQKVKIILDSRSPTNSLAEGLYVPEENYNIFLNTSSPIAVYNYSGVIVEKTADGFLIRGYNDETPYFTYFPVIETANDPVVTVGGITESSSEWTANRRYIKGQLLVNNFKYYRVVTNFTSGDSFNTDNIALLTDVPITGGKRAIFRRNFNQRRPQTITYGSKLSTSQDVVDFILGYDSYLKSLGFSFDNFNRNTEYVENWDHGAREFLFWTTQGWASGTTVSLSPGANNITLTTSYSVSDDIFEDFYGFNVLKQDGDTINPSNISVFREGNTIHVSPKNTTDGIYNVTFPLVQKEHVVLIDNTTVFNDIIYQPESGYRQERLKVLGYRSDNWNGSLDIPGFIFDTAEMVEWTAWKDYTIGTLVKYKQFYYVAVFAVPGEEEFNSAYWYRLNEKPVPKLYTNFDYKINQFTDFYDLDSGNFDAEQQRLAQHLIGYQKRDYLANIITDDVSQYKFYQGFIQDKGTKNAITKLFDPLSTSQNNSFDFYEEWAIQVGRYGALDNVQQVEFILDETKMQETPQSIELVQTLPTDNFDKVYRIRPFEVYDKPEGYNHAPFPTTSIDPDYLMSSGYVYEDDVEYKAGAISDLETTDVNQLQFGQYIWLTTTQDNSWNVYQVADSVAKVTTLVSLGTYTDTNKPIFTLTVDRWAAPLLNAGDLIGIKGAGEYNLTGIYQIDFIDGATINIIVPIENEFKPFDSENFVLIKLREVRVNNLVGLNNLIQEEIYNDQKIWVDNYKNGNWAVYQNSPVYNSIQQTLSNPAVFDSTDHQYSYSMSVTDNNCSLFVSAPNDGNGVVYYYRRSKDSSNLIQEPEITPEYTSDLYDITAAEFGKSIVVSPDGEFLAIGIPNASSVKTRFTGDFNPSSTYSKNDIIRYRESLWKANRAILPTTTSQPFTTFDTYVRLASVSDADSTTIKLLVAGNPGLENSESNHFLVRAPLDMYLGTKAGDSVKLAWNTTSFAYPTLENYIPFDDENDLTISVIQNIHEISAKIDHILFVETFVGLPSIGDRVTTDTGAGTVRYFDIKGDSAVIYINDTTGNFDISGELFVNDTDFIGFYTEEDTYNVSNNLGGFWLIETGFDYNNNSRWYDIGRGLVYVDVLLSTDTRDAFDYYNIQTTVASIGPYISNNNQASFIANLSYFGDPAGIEGSQLTNKWVVRGAKAYTDDLTISYESEFRLYDLDNRVIDVASAGFSYDILNKKQTVVDLWDGYIDFEYTNFDFSGNVFEPVIGDILEDVQTPFDEFGGLALTSYTTSSVEVIFYQRNFNFVRVYVKNKTGNWLKINNIGKVELRRKQNIAARGAGDVDRVIGTVNDFSNDIVLGSSQIGKLIVFEHTDNLPIASNPYIVDEEYWFFDELTVGGAARGENPPNKLNKDYTQIYHIAADAFGSPGPAGSGAVAIYYKMGNGSYKLQEILYSEYSATDRRFGEKLKLIKNKGLYTLLVTSVGDTSQQSYGSIEIFKHGYTDTDVFKGTWKVSADYLTDDIVYYKGNYYRAVKNIDAQTVLNISNPIYWNQISWRQGKDENYRGTLDNVYPYALGSIVNYNGSLYKAKTNIAAGAIITSANWELITSDIDYLGYLPNRTGNAFYGEQVFQPSDEYVEEFANEFDISSNGSILTVLSKQVNSDSSTSAIMSIYRLVGNKYNLDQTIVLGKNTKSIVLAPDGNIIAVSEPENDERKTDQGKVNVYRQINGSFNLVQTLLAPQNEESEKFGSKMSFSNDNLVVSSLNGDMKIPTTFDVASTNETTFDNGYTTFKNVIKDTGVVYIFEDLEDTLVYSQSFRYDDSTVLNFGETLLAKDNHVYVGMPRVGSDTYKGTVLDYRKSKGTTSWNRIREFVPPADVSKIRGAFLYNKRTNQIVTYLDFIDPIQGKIAGPAEQEIKYKVPYDPATYNVGVYTGVDTDVFWADEHVGEVWWNIKTARFTYPYQGDVQYQKANWNELQPGSEINVYEWVESNFLPSQWDSLADTDSGLSQGLSGLSVYSDALYSQKFVYDSVSQTFSNRFYFWVEKKLTVPQIENRAISVFDIARLIATPREQGYRFISFLGKDRFILNNCDSLIYNEDIVLNIKYATGSNTEQQTHAAYYIMSEGLASSEVNADIERKWFDSLVGYDNQNRKVPAENLTPKQKYGIQNRPRQSMFVNRYEALKQYIERVNLVLKENIITDIYDISPLLTKEEVPNIILGKYDTVIDTIDELRFVSTNKLVHAELTPVIQNGKIVRVVINNSGRGYKVAPNYVLTGTGTDAEFNIEINNLGQITNVEVLSTGSGYAPTAQIFVRNFSTLVSSDSTINGKWAIYTWNSTTSTWSRTGIQGYNVNLYWNYVDWYATGYNEFTPIDYNISQSSELQSITNNIGDTVRIQDINSGGWLLLEKIDNLDSEDYTINYKTVGRQNGTIEFKDTLYDYSKNAVGFDNRNFDSIIYDSNPVTELRTILNTVRDNIFVGALKVEYNNLFFATLRYVLSEQLYVDWMFKSSFIKIKHNVGMLEQDRTFNADTSSSYKSYVEEVKPYKTVIREFVSAYETIDNTASMTSDFDLPPYYNTFKKKITPTNAIVLQGQVISEDSKLLDYPRKNWLDNHGYSVKSVEIANGGSGYTYKPIIKLVGGNGTGATAEAYLGYGAITKIKVTNPGTGYITAPTVIIEGSQTANSTTATATAVLGNGVVRTPTIKIKFDRTSKNYFISSLGKTETFAGTNITTRFNLEWPMDLQSSNVFVYIDDEEQLRSTYSYENVSNSSTGYLRQQGRINFVNPPANEAVIRVVYKRPLSMLHAADRINFAYNPLQNMLGKNLANLMDGVDYGGVEITSFDFGGAAGWDVKGWYTDTWDTYDNTYEDEVFTFDGSTSIIELATPLALGMTYNVYLKRYGEATPNRIDDANYGTELQTNPNALMPSFVGDGTTRILDLGIYGILANDNDVLIVRKYTSDGSFIPDPESYDTALSGGDLVYATARGINAEEILVDGDGFVTPTTSKGPEELVPGQVLDTLDIKVYTRDSGGLGTIYSQSYIMNSTTLYDLGVVPGSNPSVFVKIANQLLADTEYTIDWINNTVTIQSPVIGAELNILCVERSGQDIIDYGRLVSDGSTTDYELPRKYVDGMSVFVSVNGEQQSVIFYGLEDALGNAAIRFAETLSEGQIINWTIFSTDAVINYSQITKDTFIADGSTSIFTLNTAPFYAIPTAYNVMVKVDNRILTPGYNIQFVVPADRQREYQLESFQQPGNALQAEDVNVFVNGTEITTPVQWRFDVVNSSIVLSDTVGNVGDLIEIYVVTDGEYQLNGNTLTLVDTPIANQTIEVFSFSNHDILGIERIKYDVVSRIALTAEDLDYVTYNRLTVGEIKLRSPAADAQYVWVSVNGELLTPSVDYSLTDNKSKVRLVRQPNADDVIDILHFTPQLSQTKFAFRQFKDMLNRTHYKRLDAPVTVLANTLLETDLRIELIDASTLSAPSKSANRPGIIFIDGERIEYFVKENNTLRQLRRGTLGTGVKQLYASGTDVFDQSNSKTVPYKDVTQTQNIVATGLTATFALNFKAASANEFEVFVSGRRLRKSNISVFNPVLALDSPTGDEIVAAEFTLSNNVDSAGNILSSSIILRETPLADQQITVTRKLGKIWTESNMTLSETQTDIAFFLRAGTTKLPE